MVQEAEKYKAEDEDTRRRSRLERLENYAYNMKNTMNDENVEASRPPTTRPRSPAAVEEANNWPTATRP